MLLADTTAVASSVSDKMTDIHDIEAPIFYFTGPFLVLLVVLGVLLAVVISAATWFLVKYFKKDPLLEIYNLALSKLDYAATLLDENDPEPYARFISETLRGYIAARFGCPVHIFTTQEFLILMERGIQNPLSPHSRLLREFLNICDQLKFARYRPSRPEIEALHQSAVRFVLATKPEPTEKILSPQQSAQAFHLGQTS